MADIITRETLIDLIKGCEGTAISFYMPTFSTGRETQENSIRLKTLVKKAREQLTEQGMGEGEIDRYLAPAVDLIEDQDFWQGQSEGLALFVDAIKMNIFRLPKRFEELVIVGESYYITPLIPIFEGDGQYFLLELSQDRPKLYKGSKFKLNQIEDLDLPASLQKMFDDFYEFHSHIQFHSKTGTPNPDMAGERSGRYFGQGGDDIDQKAEIKQFFDRFDAALMEYLNGKDAPLILAGVEFLHPLYQQANTYPNLLENGILKDVSQMSIEEIHESSWQIIKDQYETNVQKALGVYRQLADKNGDTSDDLAAILSAAYYKRINTLFVAENHHVWGKFDKEANHVENLDRQQGAQHLLGLAATYTLKNGGNVLVLPKEKIPSGGPAAAILRY